jgi:hypothetical protein
MACACLFALRLRRGFHLKPSLGFHFFFLVASALLLDPGADGWGRPPLGTCPCTVLRRGQREHDLIQHIREDIGFRTGPLASRLHRRQWSSCSPFQEEERRHDAQLLCPIVAKENFKMQRGTLPILPLASMLPLRQVLLLSLR